MLVAAGADVNIPDYRGRTPFYAASLSGRDNVLTILKGAGADVNKPDFDGCTPCYVASMKGHYKSLSILIKAGVDIDKADSNGFTPLDVAYIHHQSKVNDISLASNTVGNIDKDAALAHKDYLNIDASSSDSNNFWKSEKMLYRQTHEEMKYCDYPDCTSSCHESDLRACSYCYAVYYCSVDHQRLSWKHHKKMCRKISKCYKATATEDDTV